MNWKRHSGNNVCCIDHRTALQPCSRCHMSPTNCLGCEERKPILRADTALDRDRQAMKRSR